MNNIKYNRLYEMFMIPEEKKPVYNSNLDKFTQSWKKCTLYKHVDVTTTSSNTIKKVIEE